MGSQVWKEIVNYHFHIPLCSFCAALRRSKKRIRGVIQRELPSLLSKEFLPNQENAPNLSQSSSSGCSSNENPEMNMSKWRSLFSQMEKALSEEGKHLVSLTQISIACFGLLINLSMHLLMTS